MPSQPFQIFSKKKIYLQSLITNISSWENQIYAHALKGQAALRSHEKQNFYLQIQNTNLSTSELPCKQKNNMQKFDNTIPYFEQVNFFLNTIKKKSLYHFSILQFKNDQNLNDQQIKERLKLISGGNTRKYYMNQSRHIILQTKENLKDFKYCSQRKLIEYSKFKTKFISYFAKSQPLYFQQKKIYFPNIGGYDILYNPKTQQFCLNPKSQILWALGIILQPMSSLQKQAFTEIPQHLTPFQNQSKINIIQEIQLNPALYLFLPLRKIYDMQNNNKMINTSFFKSKTFAEQQFKNQNFESQQQILLKKWKNQQQKKLLYYFSPLYNVVVGIYSIIKDQFFNIRQFIKNNCQELQSFSQIHTFKELKIQFVWKAFKCKKILWLILKQTFQKQLKYEMLVQKININLCKSDVDLQTLTFQWLQDQVCNYDQRLGPIIFANTNSLVDALILHDKSFLLRFCESQKRIIALMLLSINLYFSQKSNKYDKDFYEKIIKSSYKQLKQKIKIKQNSSQYINYQYGQKLFQFVQNVLTTISKGSLLSNKDKLKAFKLLVRVVKYHLINMANLTRAQIHLSKKKHYKKLTKQEYNQIHLLKFFAESFIIVRNIMNIFFQIITQHANAIQVKNLRKQLWIFNTEVFSFRQIQSADLKQLTDIFELIILSENIQSKQTFYKKIIKNFRFFKQIQSFCASSFNHLLNFNFLESSRRMLSKKINKDYTSQPHYNIWGSIDSYFKKKNFKQIAQQNKRDNELESQSNIK